MPHSRLLSRLPKQWLLFSGSGRRNSLLSGLSIDSRFVVGVLVFERMVCLAPQALVGLCAQDLLQSSDSAGVPWLGTQPIDGFLAHPSIGIALCHLDEQTNEIS